MSLDKTKTKACFLPRYLGGVVDGVAEGEESVGRQADARKLCEERVLLLGRQGLRLGLEVGLPRRPLRRGDVTLDVPFFARSWVACYWGWKASFIFPMQSTNRKQSQQIENNPKAKKLPPHQLEVRARSKKGLNHKMHQYHARPPSPPSIPSSRLGRTFLRVNDKTPSPTHLTRALTRSCLLVPSLNCNPCTLGWCLNHHTDTCTRQLFVRGGGSKQLNH